MRNIAFRKTFIIGALIVMAPGMHKPNASSQPLLDLADKLQIVQELKLLKNMTKFYCDAIATILQSEN